MWNFLNLYIRLLFGILNAEFTAYEGENKSSETKSLNSDSRCNFSHQI